MDNALAAVDLEALDPIPDIHALFAYYNELYFDNKLGACSVEWSTKRMTMCAGICCYSRTSGCRIKLSEPLLKYRPTRDLKETLLHEMIHAELFLEGVKDDGDHGPKFRSRMTAINTAAFVDYQRPTGGYNITVYHTMHNEVNLYRTHVWTCNTCGNTVKRSMNRPPQEADCRSHTKAAAAAAVAQGQPGSYCKDSRCWYHLHVKHCGGSYIKISEPEKPTKTAAAENSSKTGLAQQSSSSSKRSKQPAATTSAAAGMQPIESFFNKQHDQPQQQQQQQEQLTALNKLQGLEQPNHIQEPVPVPEGNRHIQRKAAATVNQVDLQQHQREDNQQQQHQHRQQQQGGQEQPQLQHPPNYWVGLGQGRKLGATNARPRHAAQQQTEQQRLPLHEVALPLGQQQTGSQEEQQQQPSVKQLQQPVHQRPHQHHDQQVHLWLPSQRMHDAVAAGSSLEARDVIELLSSDDEGDTPVAGTWTSHPVAGCAADDSLAMAAGREDSAYASRGISKPAGVSAAVGGAHQHAGGGAAGSTVMCPVCCQEWAAGDIGNLQLNAHLDECLAR